MFRRTILAVSVLTLAACGGGGGGGGNTAPSGGTTSTPEKFEVTGSNQTTTLNKTTKVAAYIGGNENTVYIQTSLSLLEVSGTGNKIDIANGVTIDKCSVIGVNNTATKPTGTTLSCDVAGVNNIGFK